MKKAVRPLKSLYFIWVLLLSGCASVYHLADEQVQTYRITEKTVDVADHSPIEEMIAPYRRQLTEEMDQVIGFVASDLEKGNPESSLGNFVTDAVLAEAQKITDLNYDFSICNIGGIRISSIAAGPINKGKIYELMPFDNYLVTMKVPGEVIGKLFDSMAQVGGWPISHGVTFQIKDQRAQNIMINGQPFDPQQTYSFVLSDYLAEGGGDLTFLKDYPYQNLGVYYRDALIEYVTLKNKNSEKIEAEIEGRVINLDL
ncbi:MAG: 5'-nucleotidase C-terminal domain-containing protein [Saprospiraceae bacterium]|nr:5'-nucleotidase C-terminal domain-containing protein [Saprospiraceae bacterium]